MNELLDEIEVGLKFEPLLDSVIGECPVCGDEIRRCDNRYVIGKDIVCEDCIIDYVDKYFVMGEID